MNADKLKQCVGWKMRLLPIAQRVTTEGVFETPINYDWTVESISNGAAVLRNVNGHQLTLGADRIHHFDTEPQRDFDGFKHGLLEMRVQVVLSGCNVYYHSIRNFRPGA